MALDRNQKSQLYEQGYVQIPGGVPQELVHDALKAINHSLGQGVPAEKIATYRAQSFVPELQSDPAITNLLYRSSAMDVLRSVIDVDRIHPVRSGQVALRFPIAESTPRPAHPHIDGMYSPSNGVREGTISNFTALVGVLLSDLPNPNAGNFTVWPGTHRQFGEYFRRHGAEALLDGLPPIEMPEPVQITGKAGDLILAHYTLAHGITMNVSPHIRYAVFFRIKHTEIDESNWQASMQDIWLHWPGMREFA
ncbi:phytanoyl-CoA dioxygenase family protein [Paenibacillus antri]|uniref:Phytanoyl-CoA dioxygenase family protein n=1 Tax=Paenibacillus antri TaxID=2582848 RepID=A0A5R9GHE3_9BACL|nr:phytanoyl-CoA dioxygenase family protein [Paenibacillus antri]TLS50875.1 phytanoyl-CoA dioxygenase family protein [Paenibacillus antri]